MDGNGPRFDWAAAMLRWRWPRWANVAATVIWAYGSVLLLSHLVLGWPDRPMRFWLPAFVAFLVIAVHVARVQVRSRDR